MEDSTRWGVDAPPDLWEKLKPLARQKQREPTPAERKLWQHLRLLGHKFRRQHAIERFIVDFYCAKARFVIEVDGAIHEYTAVEDALRQQYLEGCGLRVVRFTNEQVLNSIDDVLLQIETALHA